jgi:VWFA-related protein
MKKVVIALAVIVAGILLAPPAGAQPLFLRGKVTMEDGGPPGKLVAVSRVCPGTGSKIIATASGKTGEYLWQAQATDLGIGAVGGGLGGTEAAEILMQGAGGGRDSLGNGNVLGATGFGVANCVLRAELAGYRSSSIELGDTSLLKEPRLPVLVLSPTRPGTDLEVDQTGSVPHAIRSSWESAQKAMVAQNWTEAERQLQTVTDTAPKFRLGWVALGMAYHNQRKSAESREAYRHALALDPKLLPTQLMMVRANLECQDWAETIRTARELIAADARHRYLEAYLDEAIAQFHQRDLDAAEARVKELLELDKAHQLPRAEYVLGLILESRKNIESAREHMQMYLKMQPGAPDAPLARARIENLGKEKTGGPDDEIDAPNMTAANPGETTVPGGMKAFAAIARMEDTPTYESFFMDYCRRLLLDASPWVEDHIPVYGAQLQTYMASVAELEAAGEKLRDDTVTVTLSIKNPDEERRTARLLRQLGWTLNMAVEPPELVLGDQPADGLRHRIPAALGIDEIAMREALETGRSFHFEIHSEPARLVGGVRWAAVLKGLPPFPGGMADVFSRDLRFAKAYAGLGAMSVDTALGLISTVGVRDLVTKYADVLALCSGAFTVSGGRVATPGGPAALPVWAKLAGADPAKPEALFRALLTKDGGRLAVFYATLAQVDEKHQRFFTADAARAQRFYEWYRDSNEMRYITDRLPQTWRQEIFGKLPLDDSGRVRFPGGRQAWSNSSGTDDEVLLHAESMDALVPVASLEEKRGAPLDAASVTLLARHYAEWRSLFPYFEKLPALGSAEFEALEKFGDAASAHSPDARNIMVGEWHSLVKLIVLGAQAGSLDQGAAARAFARVCAGLAGPDPSPVALAALREIAGGQGSVDEAVATRLLRLTGPRRAEFDLVRELQAAPTIDAALAAPTPANTLAALSGVVYAAVLNPNGLLISEDPGLLRRHRFVPAVDSKTHSAFYPTGLTRTNELSPSYMTGGFMTFEETAGGLARHKRPVESAAVAVPTRGRGGAPAVRAQSAPSSPAVTQSGAVFKVNGRLVEVHATVTDSRGRYVDDVAPAEFKLMDDGKPVAVSSFENNNTAISVALLVDATGSMQNALPPLKNAALNLIGQMRATDAVAVYCFNSTVTELQPFTTDKRAAESAVLRAHAMGGTALYDALVRVNRDLAGRTGKKAIVVFTDGDDNLSTLSAEIAIARAKAAGAPIYTIAQGEALHRPRFLDQLAGIANSTGGLPFEIHDPAEISKVFESVSHELTHGYLLTFQPPSDEANGWHAIKVALAAAKGRTVRAREGYSLE